MGWTSIYQLFWCSPGVQGFDTLPYEPWHFPILRYHWATGNNWPKKSGVWHENSSSCKHCAFLPSNSSGFPTDFPWKPMLGFSCGNQTGNLANGCCTVTIKTGPQAISLEKWWSARGTIPKLDKNSVFLPFSLRHSMGNEVDARYWWMCPIFVAWHMSFTGLSRHFCWWNYTFLWRNSYSWWHPPVRFSFHFCLLHSCLISRILLGVQCPAEVETASLAVDGRTEFHAAQGLGRPCLGNWRLE